MVFSTPVESVACGPMGLSGGADHEMSCLFCFIHRLVQRRLRTDPAWGRPRLAIGDLESVFKFLDPLEKGGFNDV